MAGLRDLVGIAQPEGTLFWGPGSRIMEGDAMHGNEHRPQPGDRTQRLADLYCLRVAEVLVREPGRVRAKAAANLHRMTPHCHPRLIASWQALLALPDESLRVALSDSTEGMRMLRRNHPFAGLVPEPERQDMVRSVWRAPA